MRVLYLSASGQLGGAETSLLDVLSSLRAARPEWPLHLVTAAAGPLVARASALGVSTAVVPLPERLAALGEAGVGSGVGPWRLAWRARSASGLLRAYVEQLRTAIDQIAPDVLHTNGLKMHLLGARASAPSRPAVVWHLHDYLGSRPLTAGLLRWHRSRCTAVVANSESVAADARSMLGGALPVTPVLNAIDVSRFSPDGERIDLEALSGLPASSPRTVRVGLLATFARWKGHHVFFDALSRLPAGLDVRAFVIGGGVYQTEGSQYGLKELRELAARYGLEGRVGFTGFVDRPEGALRALDVAVHASTAPEPFGLAIVEAMACGRAVVVSQAGGATEIVTPGADALGHRPGDAAGLSRRIAELAADPVLRARLGRAARETAVRRFDRTRLAGEFVPVYRAAAARKAS